MADEKTNLVQPGQATVPAYSGKAVEGGYAPAPVVVQQQPVIMPAPYEERPSRPELGVAALTFAVVTTGIFSIFGCFWALPCTLIGLVFGIISSATGSTGDIAGAKSQFRISLICTIAGVVTAFAGIVIIVAVVLGIVLTANTNDNQ